MINCGEGKPKDCLEPIKGGLKKKAASLRNSLVLLSRGEKSS